MNKGWEIGRNEGRWERRVKCRVARSKEDEQKEKQRKKVDR